MKKLQLLLALVAIISAKEKCATAGDLNASNFGKYRLKYVLSENYSKGDNLTKGISIGFDGKNKTNCGPNCHYIQTEKHDTIFRIKGFASKDYFQIFSQDKKTVFSWNQKNHITGRGYYMFAVDKEFVEGVYQYYTLMKYSDGNELSSMNRPQKDSFHPLEIQERSIKNGTQIFEQGRGTGPTKFCFVKVHNECATSDELNRSNLAEYKIKYILDGDHNNDFELSKGKSIGFDIMNQDCGPDCYYIHTEINDTVFKIRGSSAENGFRIFSKNMKTVFSYNQRASGRGYYMFDYVEGKNQNYTLMTFRDSRLKLNHLDAGTQIPLEVYERKKKYYTQVFRKGSGSGETKYCFVKVHNGCASTDELIDSDFTEYKLKYILEEKYNDGDDLTKGISVGIDQGNSCGHDCHYIQLKKDTIFKVEGLKEQKGFRIFSEDMRTVFSWNQWNHITGGGFYMFGSDQYENKFIEGKYQNYTLLTYKDELSELDYMDDGEFFPLEVYERDKADGNQIYTQGNGTGATKFCFVKAHPEWTCSGCDAHRGRTQYHTQSIEKEGVTGQEISLMSWNVYGIMNTPLQHERATEIGNRLQSADIILLQEAWSTNTLSRWSSFSSYLYTEAWKHGFNSVDNINSNSFGMDSGLGILSKYPIKREDSDCILFNEGTSSDFYAHKGVAYAQIVVNKNYKVHVFATHTQAHYTENPDEQVVETQDAQTNEIIDFMKDMRTKYEFDLVKDHVVLAGDFNSNVKNIWRIYEQTESIQMSPIWDSRKMLGNSECPNNQFTSLYVWERKYGELTDGFSPLVPNKADEMKFFEETFQGCFDKKWYEENANITRDNIDCPREIVKECPCCSCTAEYCLEYTVWDLQFFSASLNNVIQTRSVAKEVSNWNFEQDGIHYHSLSDHWPVVSTWKIPRFV